MARRRVIFDFRSFPKISSRAEQAAEVPETLAEPGTLGVGLTPQATDNANSLWTRRVTPMCWVPFQIQPCQHRSRLALTSTGSRASQAFRFPGWAFSNLLGCGWSPGLSGLGPHPRTAPSGTAHPAPICVPFGQPSAAVHAIGADGSWGPACTWMSCGAAAGLGRGPCGWRGLELHGWHADGLAFTVPDGYGWHADGSCRPGLTQSAGPRHQRARHRDRQASQTPTPPEEPRAPTHTSAGSRHRSPESAGER